MQRPTQSIMPEGTDQIEDPVLQALRAVGVVQKINERGYKDYMKGTFKGLDKEQRDRLESLVREWLQENPERVEFNNHVIAAVTSIRRALGDIA